MEKEALTVKRRVDVLRQVCDFDLEARLDRLEHLLVSLGRDEGDSETLGAETTSTSNLTQHQHCQHHHSPLRTSIRGTNPTRWRYESASEEAS